MELELSALTLSVSHVAHCPDVDPITCAEQDLPEHLHDLQAAHGRAALGLGLGLGRGWQLDLSVPAEVRRTDVTYTTLDGAPYDPPYLDIHHRDEVLAGPTDADAQAMYFRTLGAWTLGGRAGLTLPLGRTEGDPYAAGEAGEEHQHSQFGAGVPLGLVGASAALRPAPWGMTVALGGRVSVFENAREFRAPHTVSLAVGPTRSLGRRVVVMAAAAAVHETPERWSGQAYWGRTAALAQAGVEWAPRPSWSVSTDLRVPLYQHLQADDHVADDDGKLKLGPRVGVGVAWTPGG